MPSQKQLMDYGRAAVQTTQRKNTSEMRVTLEPGADLFDALHIESTGYSPSSSIPVIHKDSAVSAVVSFINTMLNDDVDPE